VSRSPNRPHRKLTDEEGVVLGMTVHHAPCTPEDIKRLIDQGAHATFGVDVSLEVPEIEAILDRLIAWGFVETSSAEE